MLSIVEEEVRLRVACCSEQERGWVPRRELESLLGLVHEVELLRLPPVFGRAHGSLTLSGGGAVATGGGDHRDRSAASKAVRSGVTLSSSMWWRANSCSLAGAHRVDGHWFYDTYNGHRWPGPRAWEGMQGAEQGDQGSGTMGEHIDLLIDLDQGSMTVWKNDEKLGVMIAEGRGLSGPYCWAVSLHKLDSEQNDELDDEPQDDSSWLVKSTGSAVGYIGHIENSPTAEDLDAANAWQRRDWLGLSPTATDAECETEEAAVPDLT